MNDINQRIAALSPEQRALFERELGKIPTGDNDLSIPPRLEPGPCIPSFGQERFWFLSQLNPDSPVYNLANAFRIKGALNVEALESALRHIVFRHEALRTKVSIIENTLKQVVADQMSLIITQSQALKADPEQVERMLMKLEKLADERLKQLSDEES